MSIRWRLVLFHIVTLLGIAALLVLGMFAVFGIAVSNSVEATAESRAIEAARIVESTGILTDDDLVHLNRDGVFVVALDGGGRVVSQIGADSLDGSAVEPTLWRDALAADVGIASGERTVFSRWDDDAVYTFAEPVRTDDSAIQVIEAGASYDTVGQAQFAWVTFAFIGFGILAFVLITIGSVFLVRYSLAPVTPISRGGCRYGRSVTSWASWR